MLKVAIDARPLTSGDSVRGIGVYTRELLKAYKLLGYKDIAALEGGYGIDLSKYDVVHFTSFNPFVVSIPRSKPKNTKFILTIYDLIPLIYPKHYPSGIKGLLRFRINKHLIKKNVDQIITISETSKKDICRFLGVNPEIVHVVYLAPRSVFGEMNDKWKREIAKRYRLPDRFVLYVGDINYNKNIPLLIESCRLAKVGLVVAGKQANEIGKLDLGHPELKHLKGLDWSNIVRLGFVPDKDLAAIYNLAAVYIQPSLYEGFGLPVLEAFASGTPVVAARTQALVEIAESAALFADPKNPKDFADKIKQIAVDKELRNQMVETGKVIVKNFSWEKTAKETHSIYE